jgi:hypothetical protein
MDELKWLYIYIFIYLCHKTTSVNSAFKHIFITSQKIFYSYLNESNRKVEAYSIISWFSQ